VLYFLFCPVVNTFPHIYPRCPQAGYLFLALSLSLSLALTTVIPCNIVNPTHLSMFFRATILSVTPLVVSFQYLACHLVGRMDGLVSKIEQHGPMPAVTHRAVRVCICQAHPSGNEALKVSSVCYDSDIRQHGILSHPRRPALSRQSIIGMDKPWISS